MKVGEETPSKSSSPSLGASCHLHKLPRQGRRDWATTEVQQLQFPVSLATAALQQGPVQPQLGHHLSLPRPWAPQPLLYLPTWPCREGHLSVTDPAQGHKGLQEN